ncbi:protein phosphatase 1L [Melanaphis sacchari]|uniref:Protein phosphatase 1L n=1 Tax=Melanaphis sacchari TaxID=742174 RepID=A0A2H8TK24_9HEMI|nr:protein phosphatase 1L [Melanaphis sacchari]XP_025196295.1 protein phosphatase 1L [Melanaphis sacchari]
MDDSVEDKIIYQVYLTHMKLLSSKLTSAKNKVNSYSNMWKYMQFYFTKPEVIFFLALILCLLFFSGNLFKSTNGFLKKINRSLSFIGFNDFQQLMVDEKDALSKNWKFNGKNVALYAIKGRRSQMEDRYVIKTNIMNTGISLFAIFDGHGGEFAADYATTHLMKNLTNKIIEVKKLLDEKTNITEELKTFNSNISDNLSPKMKMKITKVEEQTTPKMKPTSSADDSVINQNNKFKQDSLSLIKDITTLKNVDEETINPSSYLQRDGNINFSKILIDEVLAADKLLIEAAKLTYDIAGSTALIVLVEGTTLFVANVGDSRGVMCDKKGNAIPLSFDHKPQQMREKKRIAEAGGFISFNGVWRVAGVLATSRALGDYPLKEKQFVIANPDVLTFDLSHHDPQFIILASDGLWDTFTNEEAIECIKKHIDDSYHGAQYLTIQSYNRGSLDNITVLVIKFPPIWSKESQVVDHGGSKY